VIPQAAITEWGRTVPWPTVEQIAQDLVLSRLIVEIANDDYLGDELVFRGGTCLHKLYAPAPVRCSEDLDYVRSTGGGIRELTRAGLESAMDLYAVKLSVSDRFAAMMCDHGYVYTASDRSPA